MYVVYDHFQLYCRKFRWFSSYFTEVKFWRQHITTLRFHLCSIFVKKKGTRPITCHKPYFQWWTTNLSRALLNGRARARSLSSCSTETSARAHFSEALFVSWTRCWSLSIHHEVGWQSQFSTTRNNDSIDHHARTFTFVLKLLNTSENYGTLFIIRATVLLILFEKVENSSYFLFC